MSTCSLRTSRPFPDGPRDIGPDPLVIPRKRDWAVAAAEFQAPSKCSPEGTCQVPRAAAFKGAVTHLLQSRRSGDTYGFSNCLLSDSQRQQKGNVTKLGPTRDQQVMELGEERSEGTSGFPLELMLVKVSAQSLH